MLVRSGRERSFLLGFLTLSLLLHLLLFYLLPQHFIPASRPAPEPIMVEVVPPPVPLQSREREPEFVPEKKEDARTTPGKRLGERDIVAKKETAPQGDMPEESRPATRPSPPPAAKARPKGVPSRPQSPSASERPRPESPQSARIRENSREGAPLSSPSAPPSSGPAAKTPDLQSLLQLPPTTVARLEGEWRRKYRKDVEKGDAVWLDTEKDLLISFFQRFKNNIYGVWNYPLQARDRGEQGTCLLRVTINRDGTVADVRLLESSGSSILDQEAVDAVRKAGPYGSLPRAYEEETLKIFAFFNYTLTRTRGVIY